MKKIQAAVFTLLASTCVARADVYVAKPGDFSPPNPGFGQSVIWNGAAGPVSGLTFGSDAFDNILDATGNSGPSDTVYIGQGTYVEGVPISLASSSRSFVGDGPGVTIIDGNSSHSVFTFLSGTDAEISNLTIQNGRSAVGGGINNIGDTLLVTNVRFDSNTTTGAGVGGGALYHNNTAAGNKVVFQDCLFTNNTAPSDFGGAIYQSGGTIYLTNSTVSENHNTAIFSNAGALEVVQSTLADNTAEAIQVTGTGNLVLKNSILIDDYTATNMISNGANFIDQGPVAAGDLSYSNTTASVPSDVIEPALGDNGGPLPTYSLSFVSPAVDSGEDSDAVDANNDPLVHDQRGAGFVRISGSSVDMGAFEREQLFVTTEIDEDDGSFDSGTGAGTSLREAIARANEFPGIDYIRFSRGSFGSTDFYATGSPKTIRLTLGEILIDTPVYIFGPGAELLSINGDSDNSNGSTVADTRLFDLGNSAGGQPPLVWMDRLKFERGRAPSGESGGAFLNREAFLFLPNCEFWNNRAVNGGAIENQGTVSVINCTFEGNLAASHGGAINCLVGAASQLYVTDSTFFDNSADQGGAIRLDDANFNGDVVNSTFSGNLAATGGAVYVGGAMVEMRQVTIASNITNNINGGGGVFVASGGGLALKNCIVAGNESNAGTPAPDEISGVVTGFNTLVADSSTAGGLVHGGDGNIVGNNGTGTISFSTILQPLADNGGLTPTHALPVGSPAIDAGNDLYAVTRFNAALPNDQRGTGFARKFAASTVDMGAIESGDTIPPQVTIEQASGQNDPTNMEPIHFTVTFSEDVTGFTDSDVSLSGVPVPGSVVVSGGPAAYDVALHDITGNGIITVSIPNAAAQDLTGNDSAASTSVDNSVLYDSLSPTVMMTSVAGDPTNEGVIPVTVTFSEPVQNFVQSDLVIGNGGVSNFSGSGDTYTFDLSPDGEGLVTVDIAANAANDAAGNGNTAAAQFSRISDTVRPDVTIEQASGQGDPTNMSPVHFTATFSEPVTGFGDDDIFISGTAATTTVAVTGGPAVYDVAVNVTGNGTIIADVKVNAAQDAAGNDSLGSSGSDNVITYMNTNLTVTINQASGQADPTTTSPVIFDVEFSAPVADFDQNDVDITGTATTGVVTVNGSGTTYTVEVDVSSIGSVIANISANVAQDGASNMNEAATFVDNEVMFCPVIVYVDEPGDFTPPNPSVGDVVTWKSSTPDEVSALTFGIDAYVSIQAAVDAVCDGGTVFIAEGAYLLNAPVTVTRSVAIHGLDTQNVTIAATSGAPRVFDIVSGEVTIRNLAVIASTESTSGTDFDRSGSGIRHASAGLLILSEVIVTNCVAGKNGGALYSSGPLVIDGSLFFGNTAENGAGLYIAGGTATIINSTFSSNEAAVTENGAGGGIFNAGTLTVRNSTVVQNGANGPSPAITMATGGGIHNAVGGTLTMQNSIVAGNRAKTVHPDIEGTAASNGFNFVGVDSTGDFSSDLTFANTGTSVVGEIVEGLADNGGVSFTHALTPTSPLHDAGNNGDALDADNNPLTTDQRGVGVARLFNGVVDIGAFEQQTDITPPIITLNGGDPIFIECNFDSFSDPGANADDNVDGDISGDIIIGGDTVDESTPGSYFITYNVTDAAGVAADELTREVVVEDTTPPDITLNGASVITLECGVDSYTEQGATADDVCDPSVNVVIGGDVVDVSMPGVYVVTYDATDSEGNVAVQVLRTVTVSDTLPPVITLTGDDPQLIAYGDFYVEQGATALDACEGVVSGAIVIDDSAVEPALSGDYPVTYDVMDSEGNVALQVVRTVTIGDSPPVLNAIGDQSIDELVELSFTALATVPGAPSAVPVFSLDAGTSGAVPAGASINPANGQFSWTPGEADGGSSFTFDIVVERDDNAALTDRETITVTVNDVNVAPVLDPIGPQTVAEATPLTFTATAADTDLPADVLIFTLDPASEALGMVIDTGTGDFSWTPTVIQGPAMYSVTVTVNDNTDPGETDFETFVVTVTGDLEPTGTTLAASETLVFFDQAVDFIVNVNATPPPVGASPTGDVTLFIDEGESTINIGTVSLVSGVATFTGVTFPNNSGVLSILAQYDGDTVFDSSSDSLTIEVVPYRYSVSDVDLMEGDAGITDFSFAVARELAPGFTGDTTVNFSVIGNDADGNDFGGSLPTGNLAFSGAQTTGVILISVSGDGEFEADETFQLLLEDGVSIIDTSALGEIVNDDAHRVAFSGGGTIHEPNSFSNAPPSASGGPDLVISRNGIFGNLPVTVQIDPASQAVAGVDYMLPPDFSGAPLAGIVTIPDGSSEVMVGFTVIDDFAAENEESLVFEIQSLPAYEIDNASAAYEIAKNDFGVTSLADFDPGLNPDAGPGTLRQAVINAKAGLTRWISGESPTLDDSEAVISFAGGVSGEIILNSAPLFLDTVGFSIVGPGSDQVTVNAGFLTRVLVADDEEADSDLEFLVSGLTLYGGYTEMNGGAVFNNEILTLEQCVVSGSTAYNGGGISNEGTLTLRECLVAMNSAQVYGGGIDGFGGNLQIIDSTIANNDANFGAGIENAGFGILRVDASTVSGNIAAFSGGGVDSFGSVTFISNSTVSGNIAGFGAGLFNEQSQLVVIQSTIVENAADSSIGGILSSSNAPAGTTLIHNTIVAGNTGNGDPSDISTGNSSFVNVRPDCAFNLIGDAVTAGGIVEGVFGNHVGMGGTGILALGSILAPLSDNGGATKTHALVAGSPAVDGGDVSFMLSTNGNPLMTDQRGTGFARMIGIVDIGAYERNPGGFAIVGIDVVAGSEATVRWTSEPGVGYEVLRSVDLITWMVVKTGVVATGTQTEWTDMSPPIGEAYYKILRP